MNISIEMCLLVYVRSRLGDDMARLEENTAGRLKADGERK